MDLICIKTILVKQKIRLFNLDFEHGERKFNNNSLYFKYMFIYL